MGKSAEEEQQVAATVVSITSERNAERWRCGCGGISKRVGVRCVAVLVFSMAVFLSAVFWLPPFLRFADRGDLDLDPRFRGHDIVATFNVEKPVLLLQDNVLQLEDDIFAEINLATIRVVILSVEPLAGTNSAKVVFAIDPDAKNSKISTATESLIRESFESLVTRLISLRLTASLFGDPFSFEVLKFPGGITIIPLQSAFLLQKVQIYFNFTLNYSIEQIQANFDDLRSQLRSGLHLSSYENLYISLSNMRGSTVDPPTIVQSSVLLAIGSMPIPRLKQLAQTITGSHSRNLGLNNTIFGKVKQVRLSSILQHSLNGGDGGGPSFPPSPAPLPEPHHAHHHHHHHHHSHHHHFHNEHQPPMISPAPATHGSAHSPRAVSPAHRKISPVHSKSSPSSAPEPSYEARPPGCSFGHKGKSSGNIGKQSHIAPVPAPAQAPRHSVVSPSPQAHQVASHPRVVPVSSPLPHVVYTHVQPPSATKSHTDNPVQTPPVAPSLNSSSAGLLPTARWAFMVIFAIILQL
ncbi:E3 ubiquitin-protein ligase arkadia [Rhodamnia argentea]|uniref:E3 ubiquitin-protein ligase arkadia n=1 Tax=Rhodamnia argentea TaxID=178133 RepID=A0A8B8NTT4_9MYRT|nr:E3 ubiquitin-protein ligase arkadia [Rhodamnia argentea]